ncbi:MAG: hypothetical protein A3I39_03430 [Candidatus Yanofskybacteria bacterium RIFCSPLOWO2_02_FULL_47_9b]|uniref:DUF721 domain-containing protein n=1 Tax=Candidatus Yanofskybacteria bacterium RIFCSPLOWO2_02_FULL_47_9b TaxID=1802708 RepID=A0A1F8HBS5_9BACT|nr:MAG: hypothetical protein A3I39_03430 [Candidatus Yanofskybacteria bacterium RIFCSPLOWO2_02_FULL_47_9b]
MFRPIAQKVSSRGEEIVEKNSGQEALKVVITKFLRDAIGPAVSGIKFEASLERGNLYISTPHKSLANEIVFRAKPLYAALKQHHIVCTNLVIR